MHLCMCVHLCTCIYVRVGGMCMCICECGYVSVCVRVGDGYVWLFVCVGVSESV